MNLNYTYTSYLSPHDMCRPYLSIIEINEFYEYPVSVGVLLVLRDPHRICGPICGFMMFISLT